MSRTVKARAREWALGMSSTGKEQIAILFDLVGEHGEQFQSITWFGYFTDNTVDRTLDSLRHCGWDSDSLAELDNLNANEVELVIGEEEYDGKTRTRVLWVNRQSRLALREQMSPQAMAAFAAKLRGKTIAHKKKYGAQSAAQSKPASNGQQRRSQQQDPDGYYGPPPSDDDYA